MAQTPQGNRNSTEPRKKVNSPSGKLTPEEMAHERREMRKRAVKAHLRQSPTRMFLNAFFITAISVMTIYFGLLVVGFGNFLGPLKYLGYFFMLPITLFYHPETQPVWKLGPLYLPVVPLLALLGYIVLHRLLLAVHFTVVEDRVYVNNDTSTH